MALFNNTTLEYQFVRRYMEQGKTETYIWDAFRGAREILPMTERGMRAALKKYDVFQKTRYFNMHHARNFRTRVRERLSEKLEEAVERIEIQDPTARVTKIWDTKIKGYTKLCSNCGTKIPFVKTGLIKFTRILVGKDDGERGYFPAERTESIHYPCLNCGAVQSR